MKTISELQQEVRSIRKEIAKMDERLSNMDTELAKFKDSLQNDTNYNHIYNLAETMPIISHPMISFSQREKSIYFGILLMVSTLEDSISEQQLLFLQRMIMADADRKRIDYYMGSLRKIQPDNMIFHLGDKEIAAHANQLLLDMILIAKLGKNCTAETYGVIADIASVMKLNATDFAEICMVAAAVLTQNCRVLDKGGTDVLRLEKEYGFYLEKLPAWENYMKDARARERERLFLTIKAFHDIEEEMWET